jgi:hypothetical protein
MEKQLKRKLAAGGAAALAVAGGGAAIAADKLGSPSDTSQAIVDDAAGQLGIQPGKLSSALKKAIENQVDAAVSAGQLTKEQGDALKARIEAGAYPLLGLPFGRHGFGPGLGFGFDPLETAASYLGVTEAQLQTELAGGETLAQAAKNHGKSADGLVDALAAAEQKQLDAAVAAGRLTKDQEASIVSGLKDRLTAMVNGAATFGHGPGFGLRFGFRGGPGEEQHDFRGPFA